MKPEIIKTPLEGLLIIKPAVFSDPRGYFVETFSRADFEAAGINTPFVQDNQSMSQPGTLRGLHFQKPPHAQAKLVRTVSGSVLDVVVDIRKNSSTYGQHFAMEINAENFYQLYIPAGFAHGFLTLRYNTIFAYKCSDYYDKASEGGIMWNDPDLAINWGVENPTLSDKDTALSVFKNFETPFFD